MMRQLALAALLLAALLLFGCIDQDYYRRAVQGSGVVIDGSGSQDICAQGNCNCMVCDTYRFYGAGTTAKFYPFSYKHSDCQFVQCTFEQFTSYVQANPATRPGGGSSTAPGEDMLNFFMFGQGGFGEFNRANQFCNNSLRMPVKWLDSKNGNGKYPMPDVGRAECFLDKGAIPVYILYSNGEHIDAARSGAIAEELSGTLHPTGPVIITSEMNFNSSNAGTVSAVKDQVRALKSACPECMVALAPRIWDESDGLDEIMQEAGDSIDLFAFGIDSNNYTTCSPLLMLSDATQYSQYLLYKYKKPSILAYVLFDNTTSSDGSCTWDDSLVSEGYSAFFTYPQGFASSGILGGALYSLYGVADPLGCTDCGLYNSSGAPIAQRQATWFSGCQGAYATSSVVPLVFRDAPGTSCSYSQPGYSFIGPDFNTAPPTYTEPAGSWDPFYSCDSCLVEKAPSSIDIPVSVPDDFTRSRDGRQIDVCTDFPALDVYADIRDLDPAYVRTMALWETGFDECSVGTSGAPCGRNTEIYTIEDPLGNCPTYNTPTARRLEGEHSCDMGLIPVFAPPQQYWDEIDFLNFMKTPDGELKIAEECAGDEEFNPFLPEHNICLATYEMAGHVATAKERVKDNAAAIGLAGMGSPGDEEYENAKGLFTLFFARMEFISPEVWQLHRSEWLSKFQQFSDVDCGENNEHACCSGSSLNSALVNAGCCGPSADFVNFVSNEDCMDINGVRLGKYETPVKNIRTFLGRYLGLRQKCGICDQDAWDANIHEWATSHGVD